MMFDGTSAVTMFFVLSGFVLTHPYLAPAQPGHRPRDLYIPAFYLRRITRIWLPWFGAFALSAFAKRYFFRPWATAPPTTEWLGGFWHSGLPFSSVLRQCAFLLHDSHQLLIPQDWSLGVELKGSALIPLFLFLVRRHIPVLVGMVALLAIFHPSGQWYVSFALGVAAAKYYHRFQSPLRSLSFPWKCAVLAAGLLLYESRLAASWFSDGSRFPEKAVWCIESIGCVFILAATLTSRRIQARLHFPPVLLLGKISYSVYLLQFIVILCLLPPLVHQLNMAGIEQMPLLMALTVGVCVLATVALSVVMYYSVELPSVKLGHWLSKLLQGRLGKPPPAATAPASAGPASV